jgi:hypothetical protein
MRNFHFSIMGTDRTAWDFFHGLSLLFAANLAILTVLSWQAGDLCVTDPAGARPIVLTLIAANTLTLSSNLLLRCADRAFRLGRCLLVGRFGPSEQTHSETEPLNAFLSEGWLRGALPQDAFEASS